MRTFPLQGVANFRDFGDYPTVDGRHIAAGRLFRSGHHGKATATDAKILDELDIRLVADLRRSFECRRDPRLWPHSGSVEIICETTESQSSDLPFLDFLRDPDVTPADVSSQFCDTYRSIPYDAHYLNFYAQVLRRFLTAEGAVLVNCTHGKDRTGIACGLILWALKAEHEAIVADYLLTNIGLRGMIGPAEAQQAFYQTYGFAPPVDVVAEILYIKPLYLEAAFDEMRRRNGSVEGYLDMLGIGERERDCLRARFVS